MYTAELDIFYARSDFKPPKNNPFSPSCTPRLGDDTGNLGKIHFPWRRRVSRVIFVIVLWGPVSPSYPGSDG